MAAAHTLMPLTRGPCHRSQGYTAATTTTKSSKACHIVENTSGLGLIHESIHIYNSSDFTRPWFAWANTSFAEMLLDLAERKPGPIFKDDTPYVIGQESRASREKAR